MRADPLATVDRLRRLSEALESGTAVRDPALAAGLRVYLDRAPEGVTLEEALGIAAKSGHGQWWRVERRAKRDEAIRRMRTHLSPTGGVAQAADVIAASLRRYETSAWRFERDYAAPPEQHRGTWKWFAWLALNNGPVPTTQRQIITILSSEK